MTAIGISRVELSRHSDYSELKCLVAELCSVSDIVLSISDLCAVSNADEADDGVRCSRSTR